MAQLTVEVSQDNLFNHLHILMNLGYRDVDALIDVLVNARSYGEAWASYPVLKRYQMRRIADNFIMQSGMDLFYAGSGGYSFKAD